MDVKTNVGLKAGSLGMDFPTRFYLVDGHFKFVYPGFENIPLSGEMVNDKSRNLGPRAGSHPPAQPPVELTDHID